MKYLLFFAVCLAFCIGCMKSDPATRFVKSTEPEVYVASNSYKSYILEGNINKISASTL